MQTRLQSAVEIAANIGSGMVISYFAGLVVYPIFGFAVRPAQNAWITAIFTIISVIRSFLWRRFFNWRHGGRDAYRKRDFGHSTEEQGQR